MTVAKYRSTWYAGGRGRPPLPILPKVNTGIADLPTAARRRADEERPYRALTNVIFATFITSFRPKR